MSKFPIFEPGIPRIGHEVIFKQLLGELTKPSPAHISLVGARYFGKTVLLTAIKETLKSRVDSYLSVIYWDLGHNTPRTDEEFLVMLRKHVANGIRKEHPDEAAYLEESDASYDDLHEVIGQLAQLEKRILVIWDGFDRPMQVGALTRNLWDNLLELCRISSFRVVTGSRRRLRELIRDADSVTSDFWGVFESISLKMMGGEDLKAFSELLPGHRFDSGALKEVLNWSGGIPPLVVWLMNRVAEEQSSGAVGNMQVNDLAMERDEKCTAILEQIWGDFSAPAKDLFRLVIENGKIRTSELPRNERMALTELGVCRDEGGFFQATCRMLIDHIGGEAPDNSALARLFGKWEDYSKNIRGILERRLAQIDKFDADLFRLVERAIEDIPSFPGPALGLLSQIEDRAFHLIWSHECDEDRQLPTSVITDWSGVQKSQRSRIVEEMMDADEAGRPNAWRLPADRTKQLALLQFLTGSHQTYSRSLSKYFRKDTYALLNALHGFRNFIEHTGGQVIPLGVAVSALMLSVELLACLNKSLEK